MTCNDTKDIRILAIDPSGTGTTGICLIGTAVQFEQYQSLNWKDHWQNITQLIQNYQPKVVVYESTNYINCRGKDMTSLFKLLGGLESLGHSEAVPVNQVKGLKQKLLKKQVSIPNLTYSVGRGKGWNFKGERISVHCLEAYLVYWLWKAKVKDYDTKW